MAALLSWLPGTTPHDNDKILAGDFKTNADMKRFLEERKFPVTQQDYQGVLERSGVSQLTILELMQHNPSRALMMELFKVLGKPEGTNHSTDTKAFKDHWKNHKDKKRNEVNVYHLFICLSHNTSPYAWLCRSGSISSPYCPISKESNLILSWPNLPCGFNTCLIFVAIALAQCYSS